MTGRFPRRDLACMHVAEGPMLETLDYTIRIGSTTTFLYFDLYLYRLPTQHTAFISYLSHSVYMEIIWQERFSCRPGKAGQFLSHIYKHSYADFMLTLHMYTASHINSF